MSSLIFLRHKSLFLLLSRPVPRFDSASCQQSSPVTHFGNSRETSLNYCSKTCALRTNLNGMLTGPADTGLVAYTKLLFAR